MTRLIHTRDMTRAYVGHIYKWDVTRSYVLRTSIWKYKCVVGIPFMCETCPIRTHDIIHSYASHDFTCVSRIYYKWDVTRSYILRTSIWKRKLVVGIQLISGT